MKYCTLTGMAKVEYSQGCGATRKNSHTLVAGMEDGKSLWKTGSLSSYTHTYYIIQQLHPEVFTQVNIYLYKDLFTNVHTSFLHKAPNGKLRKCQRVIQLILVYSTKYYPEVKRKESTDLVWISKHSAA